MQFCSNYWDLDGLGSLLDSYATENEFVFNSPSNEPSITVNEKENLKYEKPDFFAEWMDEKMDLSILDGLESQSCLLDDLDVIIEDPTALLDNLMDWSSDLLESKFDTLDDKIEKNDTIKDANGSDCKKSPPYSPGGRVPDIGALSPVSRQESLYGSTNFSVVSTASCFNNDTEAVDPLECLEVYIESSNTTICSSNPGSPQLRQTSQNTGLRSESEIVNDDDDVSFSVCSAQLSESSSAADELKIKPNEEIKIEPIEIFIDIETKSAKAPSISTPLSKNDNSVEVVIIKAQEMPKAECSTKRRSYVRKKSASVTSNEDLRRQRKRVQNKDAATRYREKKRKECKDVVDVESVLEKRNIELKTHVKQLSNEISYLKGLLKEAKLRMQSKNKCVS